MLTLKITDPDGTRVLTTRPWTVRSWELRNKTKVSRIATEGIGLDDYLWMAWRQMTDDGVLSVPFEAWGPTVIDVSLEEDDRADHPTNPAPPDA